MIPFAATLIVGLLIGYLGQRSRFCIVSGVRDAYLLRNFYRIKGLLGLIIGGVVGFTAFKFMGGAVPDFPLGIDFQTGAYMVAGIIGGLGLGFFSVLAEGCPFRQHIMATEGRQSALFYLLGFYVGIIYFYVVTLKLVELLIFITS